MMPPILAPSPGFPEARAVIASFQEALRRTPPPRLVLLSSIGSEQTSGLGLITTTHLMEEALGDLPFPTAFIRAGAFSRTLWAASVRRRRRGCMTASTSRPTGPFR